MKRTEDIKTKELNIVKTFNLGGKYTYSVTFSPNGKFAAVSNGKHLNGEFIFQAEIWNIETGTLVSTTQGGRYAVNKVTFLPDSLHMIYCTRSEVKLWDIEKGKCKGNFYDRAYTGRKVIVDVTDISLSYDRPYTGMKGIVDVTDISLSYDSKYLAVSSGHAWHVGEIKIWNIHKKKHISTIKAECYMNKISVSPDGKYIASLGFFKNTTMIKVFNIKTKEFIGTNPEKIAERGLDIAFSPDGNTIGCIFEHGQISILNARPELEKENLTFIASFKGYDTNIHSGNIVFSADSKFLISSIVGMLGIVSLGKDDIKIWNAKTTELISRLQTPYIEGVDGTDKYEPRISAWSPKVINTLIHNEHGVSFEGNFGVCGTGNNIFKIACLGENTIHSDLVGNE